MVLVDPHDPAFRRLDVAHTESDDVDVVDMLLWAGGHGVAPLQDLLMLLDLERRRGYGTATRHRVADDLGINERTVRRRRDRALAALRQARPAYLTGLRPSPTRREVLALALSGAPVGQDDP